MNNRAIAASIGAAALLLIAAPARANGRFPYANQLVVAPGDAQTIVVRTTFGLLLSRDGGKSFSWICEQIIGFTNGSDPGVGVFLDGSVAVAGFFGLAVTHDGACSFPFKTGDLDKQYTVDVAVDRRSPSSGILVTATATGSQSYIQVFESLDNGHAWAKIGKPLDPTLIATNIDIAPSRRERLYVSGSYVDDGGRHGFVAASDDRGQTWSHTLVDGVTAVYLSAVDPENADRVYARSYTPLSDALLVSDDGAKTFRNVLTLEGGMWGFALSPDGSKVAAGGPTKGTFAADRQTLDFVPRATTPVTCLTWHASGLYACGAPRVSPFVVARSSDDGRTWSPMLERLTDIQGPTPACGPDSPSTATCVSVWPAQQAIWTADAGTAPDAVAEPPDAGPAPPPQSCGGCELRGGASAGMGMAILTGILALGLARMRRRR